MKISVETSNYTDHRCCRLAARAQTELGAGEEQAGLHEDRRQAAMFVAMEKGFFRAEGLELETLPLAGGAPIINGGSGDLQFGWTNVISLIRRAWKGLISSSSRRRYQCQSQN